MPPLLFYGKLRPMKPGRIFGNAITDVLYKKDEEIIMSIVKNYETFMAKRAEFEKNPMSKFWTKQNAALYGTVPYVWKCLLCG